MHQITQDRVVVRKKCIAVETFLLYFMSNASKEKRRQENERNILRSLFKAFSSLRESFLPLKTLPSSFLKDAEEAAAGSEFTTLEHKRIEAGDNWLEKRMITSLW